MTRSSAPQTAQAIVEAFLATTPVPGRRLIAIAGPPAAGKSTVAALVQEGLIRGGHPAGLMPMDGFHMDNAQLEDLGLLSRKGAPETFDLPAFSATLKNLTTNPTVLVPGFDRDADRTVPDALTISADQNIVVVEGNYLLFDADGWRDLTRYWDFSAFVSADIAELRDRLVRRWREHGLPMDAAIARAQGNDLANAERILANRLPARRCRIQTQSTC